MLLLSNCKLFKHEQFFSLGVAKRVVSQQAQVFTGAKSSQLPKQRAQVQVPSSEAGSQEALVWDSLCRQTG